MDKRGKEISVNHEAIAGLFSSASNSEKLEFIAHFIQAANISEKELMESLRGKDILVPVFIFNEKLSCLESIVKYLKENLCLDIKEISLRLNRSNKTIWATYYNSVKKFKQRFEAVEAASKGVFKDPAQYTISKYAIPLSSFKSRKLSILETIITHLKDSYGLGYSEIAEILKRDYKTIWSIEKKAKKKHDKK